LYEFLFSIQAYQKLRKKSTLNRGGLAPRSFSGGDSAAENGRGEMRFDTSAAVVYNMQ
jgi:hypothetical protein